MTPAVPRLVMSRREKERLASEIAGRPVVMSRKSAYRARWAKEWGCAECWMPWCGKPSDHTHEIIEGDFFLLARLSWMCNGDGYIGAHGVYEKQLREILIKEIALREPDKLRYIWAAYQQLAQECKLPMVREEAK